MTVCYVSNTDSQGWLNVRMNSGMVWPLPKYLKLEFIERRDKRDHFKILEGRWRGTRASVSQRADGRPLSSDASYILRGEPPHTSAATVKINLTTEQLWYGSNGPLEAFTDSSNPVPDGTHDLEIPYEPHPGGHNYTAQSPFSSTWFRIGHSGDRFLHPGRGSLGCATVRSLSDWTSVYNYLIVARADLISVGTLEVVR